VKRPEPPKAIPPRNTLNKPTVTRPAPTPPAAPPIVVKRPEPPKAIPPRNTLNKPTVTRPAPAPPAATAPKPRVISRETTPRVISPGNGLVKASPQPGGTAATPAPRIDRPPRSAGGSSTLQRSNGLLAGTAAVAPAPVTFREGPTHDSGLVRSNGLVRQIDHPPTYDHSYGGGYVVNGYSHHDYPWRHRSYVSYSNGYCAPAPVYPRWPYYSSPFYGSPLRSAVIYTSYDPFCSSRYYVPCPPTYTYCGPTRYSYCPPTYCAPTYCGDSWSFSFGFSSSSSWFGLSYGSSWSCPPYYGGYGVYRPYGYYNPCPPRHGWWHRPVWGWSTFSCDPWSLAEPRGPVYPFDTNEYTGAFGLTQAASISATEQFEEAVYSTMRGRYDTAIEMTRAAVLSTPESFAPGESELDQYQLQRATWALTVYENPPRAAVDDKDAAFMVAAIAALAGDHETAVDAASEARELGDDHPATLQLIQQLAMEDARADWGMQATMR
jgi:hypothetical protein